ncbi:transglycosylase SLT domain-containing protein, partial [Streptomyces sp. NPDC051133]|uniref:transglycosylase SLT domain-containing protein n=1 Tax=Streptomyces sp. NPDC051133 TaxID=3155521 RepID=UPI0034180B4D
NGIHRNVIRESSGNPKAINLWDSNAKAGTPSKGLLQVIQPTFDTYHVPGTSTDIYDPVANITAACNYAYHRYGSIDNVNGPY